MSNKTYVERTLETVVEFQAAHREQLNAMTERFDQALGKVTAAIDALTIQIVQLNAGIKQNSQNIDRLTQAIDRQHEAINGHLKVAEQQSINITERTRLVASQSRIAEQQQMTVNRLLERLTA